MSTTVRTRPAAPPRAAVGTVALFVVYLVLLAWIILFKLEPPHIGGEWNRGLKLVPFVRTATSGPSAPLELFVNFALFVPFGAYLGLLAPRRGWWRIAAAIAGTSATLEVAQYVLAVGRTDVTDVIVNTAGGLVGIALAAALRRRARGFLTRALALATAVIVLGCAAFILSPLRFSPQDVPPGMPGTQLERAPRG